MNYEALNNNKVVLSGRVADVPTYSHEIYGEGFYEFNLEVKRLSDSFDMIPVTISERLIKEHSMLMGSYVTLSGQFRSYNKMENDRSRLMLTVFVREVLPYNENINPNQVNIVGYLCKEPIYRTTPFKREICDILIAVNRSYNKSDYLPCIAWGRNARYVRNFEIGEKVEVSGRIQSRVYQKKNIDDTLENRVAYELSISQVETKNETLDIDTMHTSVGDMENYYANI